MENSIDAVTADRALHISDLVVAGSLDQRLQAASLVLAHFETPEEAQPARRQQALGQLMMESAVDAAWLQHIDVSVGTLLKYDDTWNGPGSTIDRQCMARLLAVFSAIEPPAAFLPKLMPLPSGGIHVEWHNGRYVELELATDGRINAYGGIQILFKAESLQSISPANLTLLKSHLARLG